MYRNQQAVAFHGNRKILVTGAFGNLGEKTLAEALRRGYEVSVFDLPTVRNKKKAASLKDAQVHLFWGDLREPGVIAEAVRGQDAVIHLAAVTPPFSERSPNLSREVNVGGTERLLEAMGGCVPQPALVFASSMSIMGADADRTPPLHVDDLLRPSSCYTEQKIACEQLIRKSSIPWIIERFGAVINTELSAETGSLKDFMSEVFSMNLDTRIEAIWNIDAAAALLNAADLLCREPGTAGSRTFFIGGGASGGWQLTAREFYTAIFEAVGFGMLDEHKFSDQPYPADWLDTEEGQELLGYQDHSFDQFILALKEHMGFKRHMARLLKVLIRYFLEHQAKARSGLE